MLLSLRTKGEKQTILLRQVAIEFPGKPNSDGLAQHVLFRANEDLTVAAGASAPSASVQGELS